MPTLTAAIDALKAKQGAKDFRKAAQSVQYSAHTVGRNTAAAQQKLDELSGTTINTSKDLSKLGKISKESLKGNTYKAQADKIRKANDSISSSSKHAAGSTRKFAASVRGATVSLRGLAAGVSAALIFRDMVRTIAGYEQSMQNIRAVTRATAEQMQDLTTVTRNLGATTKFSAQEAAEGALFLSRAGFNVNQTISALPHTLNLAAAGAVELGEAADWVSNIMSSMRLDISKTERAADVLVNTANSANVDIRQLAEAFKFAGPLAGALGMDVEEVAAAIGAMGDAGIQGTMAGRGMAMMIQRLLKPTTEARKVIESLGISIEQVNPATHSLSTVLQTLSDANMSAADATTIFGAEASKQAIILTDNIEKVKNLTQANKESSGVAKENADIMSNSLSGAFKSLRSALEEAYLSAADGGLLGALRSIVETSTGVIRAISGVTTSVDKMSGAMKFGYKMILSIQWAYYKAGEGLNAWQHSSLKFTEGIVQGLLFLNKKYNQFWTMIGKGWEVQKLTVQSLWKETKLLFFKGVNYLIQQMAKLVDAYETVAEFLGMETSGISAQLRAIGTAGLNVAKKEARDTRIELIHSMDSLVRASNRFVGDFTLPDVPTWLSSLTIGFGEAEKEFAAKAKSIRKKINAITFGTPTPTDNTKGPEGVVTPTNEPTADATAIDDTRLAAVQKSLQREREIKLQNLRQMNISELELIRQQWDEKFNLLAELRGLGLIKDEEFNSMLTNMMRAQAQEELKIQTDKEEAITAIQKREQQARLAAMSSIAQSSLSILQSTGKQSLDFQKGLSLAQASVAIAEGIAKAQTATTPGARIAEAARIIAVGAQVSNTIRSANMSSSVSTTAGAGTTVAAAAQSRSVENNSQQVIIKASPLQHKMHEEIAKLVDEAAGNGVPFKNIQVVS